jgi:hypothetical protein
MHPRLSPSNTLLINQRVNRLINQLNKRQINKKTTDKLVDQSAKNQSFNKRPISWSISQPTINQSTNRNS